MIVTSFDNFVVCDLCMKLNNFVITEIKEIKEFAHLYFYCLYFSHAITNFFTELMCIYCYRFPNNIKFVLYINLYINKKKVLFIYFFYVVL